jgi:3-isopropylmalate/(R)-2-methylmalate dehydratase small subunit
MAWSDLIAGKVWCFGDDISTDLLSPGEYALAPPEEQKLHTLESVDPRFVREVQPGDVVVAGRNFGCGSSRESAPENLKALGVACVVADSFARIFLRNAVAISLPVLACAGARDALAEGDEIEIDLATGLVRSRATGGILQGEPLPTEMLEILSAGGILAALEAFARS